MESSRERGASKSSRAANCPPSYPPYTLSLTLARNHPYPPLLPPRFPPTRPSHPTHATHTPVLPSAWPTSSSSSFPSFPRRQPSHVPPSLVGSSLDGAPPPCPRASKALDYLPLISARVAHLLPRLSRDYHDRKTNRLLSLPSRASPFHPSRFPPFSSLLSVSSTTFDVVHVGRCTHPRFFVSVLERCRDPY